MTGRSPPLKMKRGTSLPRFTITRRLFRSGESEYLIDGRQARLRDIPGHLYGTGLGPESYAIIEQGAHWANPELQAVRSPKR